MGRHFSICDGRQFTVNDVLSGEETIIRIVTVNGVKSIEFLGYAIYDNEEKSYGITRYYDGFIEPIERVIEVGTTLEYESLYGGQDADVTEYGHTLDDVLEWQKSYLRDGEDIRIVSTDYTDVFKYLEDGTYYVSV